MENTFKSICGGGVRMRIQSKVLWGYAEHGRFTEKCRNYVSSFDVKIGKTPQ